MTLTDNCLLEIHYFTNYNYIYTNFKARRPVGPTTGSPTVTVLRLNSDHEL